MSYGPYRDASEARQRLSAFTDDICPQRLGIIWSTGDDAVTVRPPSFGGDGMGLSLLFRYDIVPAIQASSLEQAVDRLDHFLGGALTRMGQSQIQQGQMQMAAARAEVAFVNRNLLTPLNNFIGRHEAVKDAVAVALDVSAVIAGGVAVVGLLAGGLPMAVGVGLALGVLAGVAGLALLWQDTKHLWFVMRGDEAGKAELEADPRYRWIEAVGPLLALPDLAMSGRAALRELTSAASQSVRAGRLTSEAGEVANGEAREFRQLMADPDQSASVLARARERAAFRAAQYKKLQVMAQRINRDLAFKSNAALSYGGAAYGGGMYGIQPPDLVKSLFEPSAKPTGSFVSTPSPRDSWSLLASAGGSCVKGGNMQITAVVATRGNRTR